MKYASQNDIAHLRQIIKRVMVTQEVTIDEVQMEDVQFLFHLLQPHWADLPTPRKIYSFATEKAQMPQNLFTKLVDVRFCLAD